MHRSRCAQSRFYGADIQKWLLCGAKAATNAGAAAEIESEAEAEAEAKAVAHTLNLQLNTGSVDGVSVRRFACVFKNVAGKVECTTNAEPHPAKIKLKQKIKITCTTGKSIRCCTLAVTIRKSKAVSGNVNLAVGRVLLLWESHNFRKCCEVRRTPR